MQVLQSDHAHLAAVVRGTQRWPVHIGATPGAISMDCSCPFALQQRTCKHLWATIRAADENGTLPSLLATIGDLDRAIPANRRRGSSEEPVAAPPSWKLALERAQLQAAQTPRVAPPAAWPTGVRLAYIIDLAASRSEPQGIVVELASEKLRADGTFETPKRFRLGVDAWRECPDPDDRIIAEMLLGARPSSTVYVPAAITTISFVIAPAAFDPTLRLMCATGRCRVRRTPGERPLEAIQWDGGSPWVLGLRVTRAESQVGYVLSGALKRDGGEMRLDEPDMLHAAGLLIARNTIARFRYDCPFQLVVELRKAPLVVETDDELPALLDSLFALPRLPPLELPPDVRIDEVAPAPIPCLAVTNPSVRLYGQAPYELALSFAYGNGLMISGTQDRAVVFHPATRTLIRRDLEAESRARQRLVDFGAREEQRWNGGKIEVLVLPTKQFERAARELVSEGWRLNVEGVAYRQISGVRASVSSGVDWFDVHATASFGDSEIALPKLIEALRRGDETFTLDDGSRGMLTQDWVRRFAPLLATGTAVGDATRFHRSQVGLLDALLAALPDVDADAAFETAREELRTFDRVAPADAPPTFVGELRPYQREGLGWLNFLRRFRLGGILADDMGLGKTVQVLALLDARRAEGAGPSLVVVPKSLVFNWHEEAARFAPSLRVIDHTGIRRRETVLDPSAADLFITTYGTLRRDVVHLREMEFDYVILDEAQAIKNASTASAKAARLLRAHHRLGLSGTPIENRIDELWSLMEFLNPGMLGSSSAFATLVRGGFGASPNGAPSDDASRDLLARALKPVILRRTKQQVARELPDRVEQTLIVELGPAQRRLYDELLARYRAELLPHVDRVGVGHAKMQILEALLRLRQAACHPGLLDLARANDESAKLDVLVPMLAEARAEGHKTLVFSQFTSFLALLRTRLDQDGVGYAYLDGHTRDRQATVAQFQDDETCQLFLISLKAGGHGLNLTAADYVFLLDPWWNPAVEAQAIDRAHRIGQTRHVIATRLVARATIEEKILELQRSKRDLADAILGADAGLIAKIGREELGLLLE